MWNSRVGAATASRPPCETAAVTCHGDSARIAVPSSRRTAAAAAGTTIAAGGALALSQSATSAAINDLERLLSLRVFDRSGKRLVLNDNGRAMLPRALALLDGVSGIERMAHDDRAQAQELRIGASTTIANYLLPPLLKRFLGGRHQDAGAGWRSTVTIGNTEAICAALEAFELDVGLVEGNCEQAALLARPWRRDRMLVVAAPEMVQAVTARYGARAPLAALREYVWLLREPGSGTRQATDALLLPHLRAYRRSIALASSEAIKHSAAEGIGVACLSHSVVADQIASGKLRALPTTLPAMVRQCYLVMHRDKHPTAALRHFVAIAQAPVR